MLNADQFVRLQKDPTSSLQRKAQGALQKLRKNYQQMFMLSTTQQDHPKGSFMVRPRYIILNLNTCHK